MSSDNNLQEMEAGTTQSKTAVNANAAAADPMPKYPIQVHLHQLKILAVLPPRTTNQMMIPPN